MADGLTTVDSNNNSKCLSFLSICYYTLYSNIVLLKKSSKKLNATRFSIATWNVRRLISKGIEGTAGERLYFGAFGYTSTSLLHGTASLS